MTSNWQSFKTGQVYTTERHCLARADILAFAEEFDPQPYHLDESAAQASIFGGLCASGWQICALTTRLINRADKARGHPSRPLAQALEFTLEPTGFCRRHSAFTIYDRFAGRR